MGDVQSQIIKTILEERFGIKVNIENPVIIHKEVPTKPASDKVSYTCVSGIELEISALERGSGFKYYQNYQQILCIINIKDKLKD